MDVALLVIRVVVGLLLLGHGTQKLFGWFGGGGITGTGSFMESIGFRPAKPMAIMAGLGEAAGGTLLALGLLTPFGCAAVIAVMMNATVPSWGKGPFNQNGGWELPLTYAIIGGTIAFTGPGTLSLDNAFDWTLTSTTWGIVAVATGFIAGALNLATRQFRMHGAHSMGRPQAV
jgi:putative oxidoreductase